MPKRKATTEGSGRYKKRQRRQSKPLLLQAPPRYKPEKKNIDSDATLNPPVGAVTYVSPILLNGIAEGTSATTRIGRKFIMTKLDFKYSLSMDATSNGGAPVNIRIVYDKQTNGFPLTAAQVFTANTFNSLNNLSFADRFITIADHTTAPVSVGGEYQVAGSFSKKIRLETVYSAPTGVVASIASGSVYLLVAQAGGVTTAPLIFNYYSRIRFVDN